MEYTDYTELAGDILNIPMSSDKAELSCPVLVVQWSIIFSRKRDELEVEMQFKKPKVPTVNVLARRNSIL